MCLNGHWIPALVEKHKSEINLKDAAGKTLLMHALSEGQDEVVRNLLDFGADEILIKNLSQGDLDNTAFVALPMA